MASLLSQHQDSVKRLAETLGLCVDSVQQIMAEVGWEGRDAEKSPVAENRSAPGVYYRVLI